MSRYRYEELSPSQFENLVVDICRSLIGKGVRGFATGPDGGRDARFDGTADDYPSCRDPWVGTTIIQAKHTERVDASYSDTDFIGSGGVLDKELPRIKSLVDNGGLDHYMLFSNRRLGANTDDAILRRISSECGLAICDVHISGVEEIDDLLRKYPDIAQRHNLDLLAAPLRITRDDLSEVIEAISKKIGTTGMVSGDEPVKRTSLERKNELNDVSDEEIWSVRKQLKKDLVKAVVDRISDPIASSHYSPRQAITIKRNLRDDVLTIGFARRFATYKRATLLFSDLDRLDAIVNNPDRPVQFLFAGKAHPADRAGQDLIRQIVEISKQDRFLGKIIFVPGYDINLAKRLVQGVDVWLNNPTRPQEASGTSGEKAAMNGVMHFSVLDGWWVEGYRPGAGWALPQERTYDDQFYQNELDSATIYNIIENDIVPAYYKSRGNGLSKEWVGYIKNTIAHVASNFTTNRMLTDYVNQYYDPQFARSSMIQADDYALARRLAAWKQQMRENWDNIKVVSYTQPAASYSLEPGRNLTSEVVLDLGQIKPEDIGVEMLFTTYDAKGKLHIREICEFQLDEFNEGIAKYSASIFPERTGMYQVATRVYPKNALLPHKQDLPLVKWL